MAIWSALSAPEPELGHDRRLRSSPWDAAHRDAAELDQIAILEVALLAGADHNEAGHVDTRRRDDLERRPAFAGKAIRRGGAAKKVADRQQRLLAGRPEFEALRAEHNKNSLYAVEGGEADLEGFGHWRSLGASVVSGSEGSADI